MSVQVPELVGLAADVKKVDEASDETLLTPRPPIRQVSWPGATCQRISQGNVTDSAQ